MKIYNAIRTALYWILTILVLVFVSTIAEIEVLRYFIGGLMIFYGIEEILLNVFKNKKHYSGHTLYWNIIEMAIGLTLVIFVESEEVSVAYAVVCVCWAVWSILRETRELFEVSEELKHNKLTVCRIVAIVNLVESLTVIALSLTMIIEPGEHHAKIHLYLLAVELFTKVLFPIINNLAERAAKKNGKSEHAQVNETQVEKEEE